MRKVVRGKPEKGRPTKLKSGNFGGAAEIFTEWLQRSSHIYFLEVEYQSCHLPKKNVELPSYLPNAVENLLMNDHVFSYPW